MTTADLDLFRTHVKIIDHEDDPELNSQIIELARRNADLNDSRTGCNLLRLDHLPVVSRLKSRFDLGLKLYLKAIRPRASEPFEVDAYMFINYTETSSFTPVHGHAPYSDLVAIYYACAPCPSKEDQNLSYEALERSYYALDEGVLVLHHPDRLYGVDRRSVETSGHYVIYPRTNRMVIHPSSIEHSVSPNRGGTRLAVTCDFVINKSQRWKNYLTYSLTVP